MSGNRSSIRSIDKAFERVNSNDTPASLHSLDMNRGIHSSHSSIDRKHGIDETSMHTINRTYEPTFYHENVSRNMDESSVCNFGVRRGSNLSLRSEDNARYGNLGCSNIESTDRCSRRGSDASLLSSTLPMHHRTLNSSNEYGISNISESE